MILLILICSFMTLFMIYKNNSIYLSNTLYLVDKCNLCNLGENLFFEDKYFRYYTKCSKCKYISINHEETQITDALNKKIIRINSLIEKGLNVRIEEKYESIKITTND